MKIILLMLCSVAVLSLQAEHTMASREIFRDDGRLSVVESATKVEACILSVKDPSKGKDLRQRVFIEGKYKTLPEEIRTLVVWKLLDDHSYTWDSVPACMPTYNARVRFTSGTRTVDVDFCFGCSQIRLLEGGVPIGGGYFSPGSDWVFRALATQFPTNPVILQVKTKREETEADQLQIEMAKARDARRESAHP